MGKLFKKISADNGAHTLTITYYKHKRDTQGTPKAVEWSDLVDQLSTHDIRGKANDTDDKDKLDEAKDGPAVVFGAIGVGKSRSKANVETVAALGIDSDSSTEEQFAKALEPLEPFEYVLYSTHKHGSKVAKDLPRLRVVLPLSEQAPASDQPRLWSRLQQMIGGINDPSTKDASRLMFLPSSFPGGTTVFHHNKTGRFLTPDDLPDIKSRPVVEKPPAPSNLIGVRGWLGSRHSSAYNKLMHALANGKALASADSEERHVAIRTTAWKLAEKYPGLAEDQIIELYRKSCDAMHAEDPSAPGVDDAVRCYTGALERIEQAREEERQKQREVQAGGEKPYDETDLDKIAESQRTGDPRKLKWVVMHGKSFFYLTLDEGYKGPFNKDEAAPASSQYLRRAPVDLFYVSQQGTTHYYSPLELVRFYGDVADKHIAELAIQKNYYDPKARTFHEAIRPVRNLKPEFNQDFDNWLKVLCGEAYPAMLEWLACAPDLNKLLCAVYFQGAPGAGKSLLAHGLARLWTEDGPSDAKNLISDFNEDLVRCPLVFADEKLPTGKHNEDVTAILREQISTTARVLNTKHISKRGLKGAIRLIIAANNANLLSAPGVASNHDLEAIAQRFLLIDINEDAVQFLKDLPYDKQKWITEDIVAKHALWLQENLSVVKKDRFWVEGSVTKTHMLSLMSRNINSLVIEFICRYMNNPTVFDNSKEFGHLIRRDDGHLYANSNGVIGGWPLYMQHVPKTPLLKQITDVLKSISVSETRKRAPDGRRPMLYEVNTDLLWAFNEEHKIADLAELQARLDSPAETDRKVVKLNKKEGNDNGDTERSRSVDRKNANEDS